MNSFKIASMPLMALLIAGTLCMQPFVPDYSALYAFPASCLLNNDDNDNDGEGGEEDQESTISVEVTTPLGTVLEVCHGEIDIVVSKKDAYGVITSNGTVSVELEILDAGEGVVFSSSSAGVSGVYPLLTLGPGASTATITYLSGTSASTEASKVYIRNDGSLVGNPIVIHQIPPPASPTKTKLLALDGKEVEVNGNQLAFEICKYDKRGVPTYVGAVTVSVHDIAAGSGMRIYSDQAGVTGSDTELTFPETWDKPVFYYVSGSDAADPAAVIKAETAGAAIVDSDLEIEQIPHPTAVNLRLSLEGASLYSATPPFMNTELNDRGHIPLTDPYDGSSSVERIPAGTVDWVHMEFRTAPASAAVGGAVGLLRRDGKTVASDGLGQILVDGRILPPGMYYVVVRHRNHLHIMSAAPVELKALSSDVYDFTTAQSQAFFQTQKPMQDLGGVYGLIGGDADILGASFGVIDACDRSAINQAYGKTGYIPEDVTMDGVVNAADEILVLTNTFKATQVP